ncbi:hypothetical protein SETIT_1G088500v2 [Setaria italica]|uniref:Glabrous enhancer-binding protein-like DBD domain-containing protein n=1 Tax=Setaria italica TaxID=4555 RepID=A0A368PI83_SETIT|nr:hypothetical protein SETIT_1G088500v2 [Setaria italica]
MGIPNFQILASPLSTASSDDTTTTNVSDEHLSPPSSPSISFDSVSESDASTSSSVASDGSSGSEPVVSKKPRLPVRSWLASDEIALLEAVSEHRQKHGRLPSPNHLAAALRSRLRAKDRLSADEISRRLRALRSRYDNAVLRMSRGTIPVKDDDVTIYKLSKLIWEGTRKGKREKKTRAADMRKDPREFGELTGLYPCLSAEVEAIDTGSGAAAAGLLKRAFERIGDDTAARLEAKVKMQRVAEARASAKLDQLRTNVAKKVDWLSFPSSPLAATEATAETPPPSCSVLTAWRPRVTAVRPRQAAVVFQAPPMLVIVLGIQIPCTWNQGVGAYGVGLKLREPAWCLPCCDDLIMGWSRGLRYIANSQQHGVPLNQGNLQRAHS